MEGIEENVRKSDKQWQKNNGKWCVILMKKREKSWEI